MRVQYHKHSTSSGEEFITVFIPGDDQVYTADGNHPNFAQIVAAAEANDPGVASLFDVAQAVADNLVPLSRRVAVAGGHLFFDGDRVDNSLARHIVRALGEDWNFGRNPRSDTATALINFMEKVQNNPVEHSREQLYDWLDSREFSITPGGDFIAYKGVSDDGNGGWRSGHSGEAYVDGKLIRGQIPNYVGAEVTMPRSKVVHDPSASCSHGLHVGTYDYAKAFANGALLKVYVDPADAVSVPQGESEKMRVCRYRVAAVIDAPETRAVAFDDDDDFEDEAAW